MKAGWRSEVMVTTGTGKKATRERGVTAEHADEAAARAAVEKVATDAEKMGWQRKAARSLMVRKPDAFAAIPKPAKAKKYHRRNRRPACAPGRAFVSARATYGATLPPKGGA